MKIGIEDYLQQIDTAFKYKSQKDIYVIYFMVFALIFAVSYLFFWESSMADFQTKSTEIKQLDKKIQTNERYLKNNPKSKIARLSRDIKNINKQMLVYIDNNDFIKSKIENISELLYDEKTWGKYINSIAFNAQKYHITILHFSNQYAMSNQAFGHILNITLEFTASYKDTLKFINSLEESDLVVDVHKLDISAEDVLTTTLDISVWGITE